MSKVFSVPFQSNEDKREASLLMKSEGSCFVYPTETTYAIGCLATDAVAVERIYQLKQRKEDLPLLVLVSSFAMFENYSYPLLESQRQWLISRWPAPLTVVTLSQAKLAANLHKNNLLLGFRHTLSEIAVNLVQQVQVPLVGTSCNIHGKPAAMNIKEATSFFGDAVDIYFDAGTLQASQPSSVVKITAGSDIAVLREGAFPFDFTDLV